VRFKPCELCYWKVKTDYSWDYRLVQFVGKKEPPKGAVESSNPEDWSYRVWLVSDGSSSIRERLVKDSELFGKEVVDSDMWKALS